MLSNMNRHLLAPALLLLTIPLAAQTPTATAPTSAQPASRPTPPMAPMTTAEAEAEVVPQMAVKGSPTYAPNLPRRTRRCLITDSGAVGDGKTVNTKSIQSAIDKCAENKNGGTLVVPRGTFISGSIFLKQGVNLLVEKDGVLKGTVNIDDYPELPARAPSMDRAKTGCNRTVGLLRPLPEARLQRLSPRRRRQPPHARNGAAPV